MTVRFVKETPSYGKDQKIDFIGMILSAAALFSDFVLWLPQK
jgi:hypothetical protein